MHMLAHLSCLPEAAAAFGTRSHSQYPIISASGYDVQLVRVRSRHFIRIYLHESYAWSPKGNNYPTKWKINMVDLAQRVQG